MTERSRINLSWLLTLRWAAVAGQLTTVFVVAAGLGIEVPLVPLLTIIAIGAVMNAGLQAWFQRRIATGSWGYVAAHGDWLLGSIMIADILLLSGLLYFSGGPGNPFSIFYLVNLTLATVVLKSRWAWALCGVAVSCYAFLFFDHITLPALNDRELFGWGMLVAFSAASTFIVYFITRVTTELAQREAELSIAEKRKAEAEKIEALGTLAAGAAHELSTPLSTIAVIARELELHLERNDAAEMEIEDARLIRQEVARCRKILDQMATDAGESTGEEMVRMAAGELLDETLAGMRDADRDRVEVQFAADVEAATLLAPRQALAQSLRGLVQNALDASAADEPVACSLQQQDHNLQIIIRDEGPGMPPGVLARAGDPFFTTKEPGQGMGLGLFLARKVIERLGGTLTLDSQPQAGTTVTVTLPLGPAESQAPVAV